MDTNLKVSIGLNPDMPEDPNVYTRVNFDFEIQADRIKAITKQLQTKTGKQELPTIIFEFPQSAQDVTIPLFNQDGDEREGHTYEVIQKDGRVYRCINLIIPQFVSTRKKIQKVFSKLTELDNKLYLHIDIYNMDNLRQKLKDKQDYAIVVFLQKIKIEGKFMLDPKFFQLLTELISKVSPKFAESPIMALLPLFGGIDCELQLDSLNQLQAKNQEQLFSMMSYEDPADNEGDAVIKNFNNKDKVYIYLNFGTIGIFKIEVEVRMFVFYNCLN